MVLTGKTQYLEDVDEARSKFGFKLRDRRGPDGQLVIGADIGTDRDGMRDWSGRF